MAKKINTSPVLEAIIQDYAVKGKLVADIYKKTGNCPETEKKGIYRNRYQGFYYFFSHCL